MKKNILLLIACFATFFAQAQLTGNSIKISQVNNYVTIPDALDNSLSNDMTIEAWIYVPCNYNTGNSYTIISKGECYPRSYSLTLYNHKLEFLKANSLGVSCGNVPFVRYSTSASTIQANTWYHVAVVMQDSNVTYYINGLLESSTLVAGTPFVGIYGSGLPIEIGSFKFNNTQLNPFLGNVDDVRIWNTARTATEISANYNTELIGNEAGLKCYWKLNETGTGAGIVTVNSATSTGSTFNGTTVGTVNKVQFENNINTTSGPSSTCPVLWLKADAETFVTGSTNATNGQTLENWFDQSGYNNNATCATASYRPTYVTNVINGLPVVRFSNNFMQTSSIDLSTTDKTDMYIVYKSVAPNTNWECVVEHGADYNTYVGFNLFENAQTTAYNGIYVASSGGGYNAKDYPFKANEFKVVNSSYDKAAAVNAKVNLRINGKEINLFEQWTSSGSGNFANYPLYIGNRGANLSYPLSGDIAEIIMYNRKLTPAEKITIESYLNTKYNITCAAPVITKPGSGNCLQMGNNGAFAQDDADIDFSANDFTVEFWTMKRALTSNWSNAAVINKWNAGTSYGTNEWFISTTSNGSNNIPALFIESGTTQYGVVGTTDLAINKWYHIAAVREGNNLKMYVNGILENTVAIPPGTSINNLAARTYMAMGYYPGYSNNSNLDEVRIWNTALSQATIRDWMCKKETALHPNHATLARYYKFDETSGTTFNNSANGCATEAYGNGGLLVTSGAAIGDVSAHDYTANTASANINMGSPSDNLSATMNAGTSAGVQVYGVNELPNNQNFPGIVGNNKYAGVFVVNGNTTAAYNAVYNYTNNTLVTPTIEPDVKLFRRQDNAGTWTAATAQTLDMNANTITSTGQNTEYILGNLITPIAPTCYGDFLAVGDLLGRVDNTSSYKLLDSCVDNFTYEVWVNPVSTLGGGGTSGDRYVIMPEQAASVGKSGYGIGVAVGTNGIRVYAHTANYLANVLGYSATITSWTHIAVVVQNQIPSIYINGLLVTTGTAIGTCRANDTYMNSNYYNQYFGKTTDFRLWNYARTGSQIMSGMNTVPAPNSTGLMSSITFDNLYNGRGQLVKNNATNYPNLYLDKITVGTLTYPLLPAFNCTGGNFPILTTPSCAAKFNGTSRVDVTTSLGAFPAKGTIEFWLNQPSFSNWQIPISTTQHGTTNVDGILFQTYANGDLIVAFAGAANTQDYTSYGELLLPNTNYHVVVTWDTIAKNYKGYLNGRLMFVKPFTTAYYPTTLPRLTMGAGYNGGRYYNGTVDEVRYWNVERTQTELINNANDVDTLASGLVAYYNFFDNLLPGNGQTVKNKATNTGASLDGVTVNYVKFPCGLLPPTCGIKFNGTTDCVEIPDNVALHNTNFTYSAWVKTTSTAATYSTIVAKNYLYTVNNTDNADPALYIDANHHAQVTFQRLPIVTNGAISATGTTLINDGEWHNVAGTFDGTTLKIYVDGVMENSTTTTYTPIISTDPLYIGCVHGLNRLNGYVDEVSVWNFARTAFQIQNNLLFPINGTDSGLVAYYNFNDNDRSGQNRVVNNLCASTGTALNGLTAGTALTPVFECAPPPFTNPECNLVTNGATDYLVVSGNAALSNTNFAVAAYVKTNQVAGLYRLLIKNAGIGRQNYSLLLNNGHAQIRYDYNPTSFSAVFAEGTSLINNNTWHYIVGTYDGANLKIYVDGILETTTASTNLPITDNTQILEIGASSNAQLFNGSIDEISVWNSSLSQTQITSLIGQQLVGNEANLVAYYNFDNIENNGQNVTVNNLCNTTGTAINGTSIGTANTPIFTCSKIPIEPVSNCNLLMNGFNNAVTSTGANASFPYTSITQNFTMEVLAKPLLSKGWASSGPIPIWPPGHYLENGGASGQRYVIGPDQGAGYAPGHAGVGISLGTNGVAVYEHSTNYMPGRINLNNYPINDWVHLTLVSTNGALKLYVNGVPSGSANASGYVLHPSVALSHPYGAYAGYVGEVRVWNTALTSDQIRNNINANLVGNEANLVSLYKFGNNDTNGTNHIIPGLGSMANTITYKTAGTCSTPIFSCATDSTVTHDALPGSGKMLAFGGVGSFAELGNLGNIPVQGSLLTWFNASTLKNNAMVFSTTHFRNKKGRHQGLNVFIKSNGNLMMTIGVDTSVAGYQDTFVVASNIIASKWYHFALTWDTASHQFTTYINGIATLTNSTTKWPNKFESFKAGIGIEPEGNYAWNGYIDELSEWNKTLSQAEVRQQMCSKINSAQANYANVLHNYRFDNNECGGDAIHDYAGNAHGINYNWYWYSYYNSVTFQIETFKIYTHDNLITSSAPIGSYSSYDYSGNTSQQNLVIDNEDSVNAQLNAGTADGIHVYGENYWPNTINGIFDTVAGSNHYAGVWVVNPDTAAKYILDYNYTNNPNVTTAIEPYIHLYKRNHNADYPWLSIAGITLDTAANQFTAIGQHTEFILGKTATPLAINELSFTVVKQNNNANLNWNVNEIENVNNFEVMRSVDGKIFTSIAKVAKENSLNYTYTDANLLNGKYFYKIKMNDVNGSSILSNVHLIEIFSDVNVQLYPNPASNVLSIETNGKNFKYAIHNNLGQTVYEGNSNLSKQTINIQSLSKGIYTVSIQLGLKNYFIKFNKL